MNKSKVQMTFADDSEEYKQFVDKFKPKRTTDDCYTPPEIYDVILDYVVDRYGIDRGKVVRPFWPDGDYEREEYPDGAVVVDNPPFSMLAAIVDFYMTNSVGFFLFAPTLTCISHRKHILSINHIVCHTAITYENGAKVSTSFVTNLDTDGTVLEANPELSEIINAKDDEIRKRDKVTLPKYVYPDHVMTAAKAQWFAAHGTPYKLNARDCCQVHKLDAMGGKTIFGGGLLLNDAAAAERAAAERAAAERAAAERAAAERAAAERAAAERAAAHRWQLSERELKIVEMLGNNRAVDK